LNGSEVQPTVGGWSSYGRGTPSSLQITRTSVGVISR
jgi:hypothetical protein